MSSSKEGVLVSGILGVSRHLEILRDGKLRVVERRVTGKAQHRVCAKTSRVAVTVMRFLIKIFCAVIAVIICSTSV